MSRFDGVRYRWHCGQTCPERCPVNVSLTPELEKFVKDKVRSGLYSNASEVLREGLRLLKEDDERRENWRDQIERGWQEAQRGELVDGATAFRRIRSRLTKAGRTTLP